MPDRSWTMSFPVKVEFGAGCVSTLPGHMVGIKKALLVTGRHAMEASGVTGRVSDLLKQADIECVVYNGVSPNPDCTEIDKAAVIARGMGAEAIIGCGGGSAIDAAKGIAVVAAHPGPVMDYMAGGPKEATEATLPVFAISSTSGTGSHVGRNAVVSDRGRKIKRAIRSDFVIPRAAICDSEILRTMPPEVTACSGFDAFAHAIEGYLSTNENPFGNMCAREAIRIIARCLPKVIVDGDNLDLREQMAWADTLAGISLTTNLILMPHALSMIFGGRYGITHARAIASVMVACLSHSKTGAKEKLAEVARLFGCMEKLDDEALADRAIAAVDKLIESIGLKKSPAEYGIPEDAFASIADEVKQAFGSRMEVDPVPLDTRGVEKILHQSVNG